MTTLQQLIDRIQNQLSDSGASVWSEGKIEEWIETGIAEYSQHFPRTRVTTITDTVDVREYDLPADFLEVLSVQFPTTDDPPVYLKRRAYTHPDFWDSVGYYDIVPKREAIDPDQIFISESPNGSQAIEVVYLAQHDTAYAVSDTLTIPRHHETIIERYVIWQAWQELTSNEMQNPTSNSSLLMAQLEQNTTRAERRYLNAIAKAEKAMGGQSAVATWDYAPQPGARGYIY